MYVPPSIPMYWKKNQKEKKLKARDIHLINLMRKVSQISRSYYYFLLISFPVSFKIVNDKN